MINNYSNLTSLYKIQLTNGNNTDITINNFSLMKFSSLYLSQRLPLSVKILTLNLIDKYFVLLDCISSIL